MSPYVYGLKHLQYNFKHMIFKSKFNNEIIVDLL